MTNHPSRLQSRHRLRRFAARLGQVSFVLAVATTAAGLVGLMIDTPGWGRTVVGLALGALAFAVLGLAAREAADLDEADSTAQHPCTKDGARTLPDLGRAA